MADINSGYNVNPYLLLYMEFGIEPQDEEMEMLDEVDSLIGDFPTEDGKASKARRAAQHDIKADEAEERRPAKEARKAVREAERRVKESRRLLREAESANRKANKLRDRIQSKMERIEDLRREIEELQSQESMLRLIGSDKNVADARRNLELDELSLAYAKDRAHIYDVDQEE